MKSSLNKLYIIIILMLIILAVPIQASAASAPTGVASETSTELDAVISSPFDHFEKAIDLKILGLLANSPEDFQLERSPTRAEGAVMLVRLLGKEHQVMQSNYKHPFTDVPKWADNYIGYIYQNGITNGISKESYGSDDFMTAGQYVTFVLRSMGYEDNVDFSYTHALDKAWEIGLLTDDELSGLKSRAEFLRNDLVAVSYNALTVKIKRSSQTLIEKLVDTDKAIFKPAAEILYLYPSDLKKEYGDITAFMPNSTESGYVIKNRTDLERLIAKTLCNHDTSLNVDSSGYSSILDNFGESMKTAIKVAEEASGVTDFLHSWEYVYDRRNHRMVLDFEYRYSKDEYESNKGKVEESLRKSRHIVAEYINHDMSEFEKEKTLHDYLINNTRYDYDNYLKGTLPPDAFEEYGCLVSGYAVCEGYAEAMKLLCDLAGIECLIVKGDMKNNGVPERHAWNLVKVDGEYYHLDVTNDDPVVEDGTDMLTYCYFNLTDDEMRKTCTWDSTLYPACTSTENSYYHKYNMVADNRETFAKVLTSELQKGTSVIELKVKDYSRTSYSNISDLVFKTNRVLRYCCTINDQFGIIRIFDIEYL